MLDRCEGLARWDAGGSEWSIDVSLVALGFGRIIDQPQHSDEKTWIKHDDYHGLSIGTAVL